MRKILRIALIVLMTLGVHSTINARVVDYAEALQEAIDFFRSNDMTAVASDVKEVWNSNDLVESGVATVAATAVPTFYVFAPEEGKGFVIVSADDATMSILGYSLDKEILVGDDMPTNFRWWCEMIDKLITQLRATGTESAKKNAASQAVSTLAASDMLLETAEWNQYEPYNLQCPMDGSSRSVTGCVPVSFAIAMRYHEYPTQGIGQSDAYYTDTKGIYVESRDLSSHVYDWDNMLLQYGNTWTDAQGSAVATLIADIGCVLHADYTSGETGTPVGYSTPTYFYEHFNYSSASIMLMSPAYSDAEWTEFMKNEIATNGPVPYTSINLVHQVVLDGYNSNNYFHINWGWGGANNGYFLLPDIADGVDQQWAFLDFIPDDGKKATTLALSNYSGVGVEADTDIFTQNVPFTMSQIYFVNAGSVDFNGIVAFGLTDSDGNVKEIISSQASIGGFGSMYISGLNATTCTITASMVPGDCIRLCYKNNEDSDWRSMLAFDSGLTYKIVLTEDMINKPYDSTSGLYFNILNDNEVEITWGGKNNETSTPEYTGDIAIPQTITYLGTTYNVTAIGDYAFYRCPITSLSMSDNVKTIGTDVFYYCSSLTSLSLSDNIETIGDGAFYGCYNLPMELIIPEKVTTIGEQAFYDCEKLTSVTFNADLETIGRGAFSGCTGLKCDLVIPDKVTSVGINAFYVCPVTSITVGKSVKTIGNSAFFGCSSATFATLGTSVETIGENAFYHCYALTSVTTLNPTPPSLGISAFNSVTATIYVPAGTTAEYKRVWGDNQGDVAGYEDLSYAVLILSLTDENGTAYTTYYNEDYDIDIADTNITAYWAENVEDDAVTLAELSTSVIPAKTAVLLKGEPINYMPAGADSPSASASAYASNLFYGQSTTKTIDDLGSGYQYYTLSADTNGENLGFYYGVEGGGVFECPANKAWLVTPAGLSSVLSLKFKDNTTGISSLSPDYGENDATYTIQGVRVNSMNKPGVYIVGGKKVLVK